ncbi:MAG: type II secretion system protein, partial [Candidatus Gastranaerophilales bacterium]
MLKPSWIIRVLVGVTSHSNKRVRFSHPTENPQVQHDENPLLNRIQSGSRIPLRWNASEQRQKANPSVRAGVIPLLWRGDREVGVVSMKKRPAFTLAEVLITLGIIGVVSAMTIPNLISNYQYKALDTKKTLFQERLYEAMNQMRFHEKLTGYSDAEDFVAELGKYLKINETCDLDDMTDCFPDVTINSCDEKVYVEDLETGEDFAANTSTRNYNSDNVGVVFADGTKTIINYDLNCEWLDPYEGGLNRTEATQCVTLLADVNGNTGKNAIGSDILAINTTFGLIVGDICWDTSNSTITAINCAAGSGTDWDNYCAGSTSYTKDYWAGAMKVCLEAEKRLPKMSELAEMHNYIFNTDVITAFGNTYDNLTLNNERITSLGFDYGFDEWYRQWSSEVDTDTYAYGRYFNYQWSLVNLYDNRNGTGPVARCVRD